jgi:hypothetical protein
MPDIFAILTATCGKLSGIPKCCLKKTDFQVSATALVPQVLGQ